MIRCLLSPLSRWSAEYAAARCFAVARLRESVDARDDRIEALESTVALLEDELEAAREANVELVRQRNEADRRVFRMMTEAQQ